MSVLDKFLDAIRLNDDFDDEDEFFDDEDLENVEEKPKHRFFKKLEDDDDDDEDFFDENDMIPSKKSTFAEKAPRVEKQPAPAKTSSKITPMRSTKKPSISGTMEVCVSRPSNMEDTSAIADTLLENCTVILNLEGIDVDMAQRIIDFSSGCCYAINGNLQKVSNYIFILTPANVEITGDFQEMLNGNFDVPYVHTTF